MVDGYQLNLPLSLSARHGAVISYDRLGDDRNLISGVSVLLCDIGLRGTMKGDTRDLVSAMVAIGYTAFLLMLGELYITSRSTELPAISLKQSGSMSRALHAIAAD